MPLTFRQYQLLRALKVRSRNSHEFGLDVQPATVYSILRHLERQGLVSSKLLMPRRRKRGSKAQRFFSITDSGLEALKETRKELK